MNRLINFLSKYVNDIKPFDYFLITAIVLLIIPYIYKLFNRLYKERLKSSMDLIKLKEDIIVTQEKRAAYIEQSLEQSLECYRNKSKNKTIKLKEIEKTLRPLQETNDRISTLTDLSGKYTYSQINIILQSINILFSNLSYISVLKSMLIISYSLDIERTSTFYNTLSILDRINIIEQKLIDILPDDLSIEFILEEDDIVSKQLNSNEFKILYHELEDIATIIENSSNNNI